MPQIGHFQAWIDVENEQLLEYGVEYSADGKQATCWIPSETGKVRSIELCSVIAEPQQPNFQAFLICVKDSLRTQTCATKLFVDGLACGGTIMRPISTHPHRRSTCIHRGISVTDQAYRPFIFSNCELTGMLLNSSYDPHLYSLYAVTRTRGRVPESLGHSAGNR